MGDRYFWRRSRVRSAGRNSRAWTDVLLLKQIRWAWTTAPSKQLVKVAGYLDSVESWLVNGLAQPLPPRLTHVQ